MTTLANHYQKMQQKYPDEDLLILFDIDGTILDMRNMVLFLLNCFDREHKTSYFSHLGLQDISVHENDVVALLTKLSIKAAEKHKILEWYNANRWQQETIMEGHRPFRGVLEIIRWFQIQPRTFVGVNSGRPEKIRAETVRSINKLGNSYRVNFSDELTYLNRGDWEENVVGSKVLGIREFQNQGYKVIAFIDNEPSNLESVENALPADDLLLLHADTIFEFDRKDKSKELISGTDYNLENFLSESSLPQNVHHVWHGINDAENLKQFLNSTIQWGEVDVRQDGLTKIPYLCHDDFSKIVDLNKSITTPYLHDFLVELRSKNKKVKIDLKLGSELIDIVLDMTRQCGFPDQDLWFNGKIDVLTEGGIARIKKERPGAIIQIPIDFLTPMLSVSAEKVKDLLQLFTTWGVNRFSLNWQNDHRTETLNYMDTWQYEVNIWNIHNLEAFMQANLMLPASVTSDFNFPSWRYYGRGSGMNLKHHVYK